ncbi:hypothetical protein [Flexibacterium corallicola]|uniref:hypothetical protein n=1 Tax=Flexibacterium corallicola TaxID=3037259 RepID=UPI00286F944C|nr:hypothetical protein [Pseudovibrio sp. M1P-2-3]
MKHTTPQELESDMERKAFAEYCGEMCHELAQMADENNFPFLSYMLEITEKETENICSRPPKIDH